MHRKKAYLAQLSYNFYEDLLKKVFLDRSVDLNSRVKILLYCFFHKAISYKQTCVIFVDSYDSEKSLRTTFYRLVKNGLMKKVTYGKGDGYGHYITSKGIEICSVQVKEFHKQYMKNEKLSIYNYEFTIDEIVNYLRNRCSSCQPKYWRHFLATRDIFAYLLSGKSFSNDFYYETEVAIDPSGTPVSLYTRSLLGLDLKYQIRSDGMLTYKTVEVFGGSQILKFFIEVDNGSQSSSVISDKVRKYLGNLVESIGFKENASLMFCINTEVASDKDIGKDIPIKSSTSDYYYGRLLVVVYDLLQSFGVLFRSEATIDDVISVIEDCNIDGVSEAMNQVIEYFRYKTSFYKEDILVSDLYDLYKERIEKRQLYINIEKERRHHKKYLVRRALIYSSINEIQGLHDAFLKGFSLYTVSNYNLDKTLPYVNIEFTYKKIDLLKIIAKYGLFLYSDGFDYKICLKKENILLRNFYYSKENDKGIAIENISDDLGGFYRVKNLLESDEIPPYILNNVILVCICDSSSIDDLKEQYLNTKQGRLLSESCTDYIKYKFEVLFITYEKIFAESKFFTFSQTGNIVYKDKPIDTRYEI